MTIATLMATTAIFLVKGWTAPAFGALAITIGGVVCVVGTAGFSGGPGGNIPGDAQRRRVAQPADP